MSETELPLGRTKFLFGQKIDSIELRTTKMAGKGEEPINWKPGPVEPPCPLRRKKQILTNHSNKRDFGA
jgi:hypothetical protein